MAPGRFGYRPALTGSARLSPVDSANLARLFPGRPEGTYSERLAHVITHRLMRRADLLVDLHGAGAYYSMPAPCGHSWPGDEVSARSRRATSSSA